MHGILVLEDGHFYRGELFSRHPKGATPAGGSDQRERRGRSPLAGTGPAGGEVVFNTSPTGYQEILTDPSYVGQIVVLTTSHVGNYGVNADDVESAKTRVAGLVVRDYHPAPSNWRSDRTLASYLEAASVPALSGVDTRALVLHIREAGAVRGVITLTPTCQRPFPLAGCGHPALEELVARARRVPSMAGLDLVPKVTREEVWTTGPPEGEHHVVALDFGIKLNIVRQLVELGCRVSVVPATTDADTILSMGPSGVLLSNGPGDPEPVTYAVETIRALLGKIPLFGICLGHQLLALACGGKTYKMHFGHRGGNHPVRDVEGGRVEITAQNHGFAVQGSSLDGRRVAITHVNLNDDSVEGLRHRRLPAFSVQFHPEASPGPHDSHHLFRRFVDMMERWR